MYTYIHCMSNCITLLDTHSIIIYVVPDRDIGVKEPSLVEHVKNILQRYPEGGQILKVAI